jgi:hypothetical protein
MTSEEIVKALREDCKTCSESLICENGTNLAGLYCANKDAADLIERLTAENAALREKQRWVPVIERMPNTIPCNAGTEYSEAVIVWTNGNKAMIAVWDGIDFICPTDFWGAWGEEITHWMPLPEAPEEGGKHE